MVRAMPMQYHAPPMQHHAPIAPYGKGMQPMMQMPMAGKGGKPMRDGDWICLDCGNHNFASRTECNRCAAVRPGFKKGDWLCKSCGNHNYASRTECNKCGAAKDQ